MNSSIRQTWRPVKRLGVAHVELLGPHPHLHPFPLPEDAHFLPKLYFPLPHLSRYDVDDLKD